jgi:hypothetical protein
LISPPAAVLLIAPAKVWHGAVLLHGFASLPTPDTHVRVACALSCAADANRIAVTLSNATVIRMNDIPFRLMMKKLLAR